jgi:hypothetical protein
MKIIKLNFNFKKDLDLFFKPVYNFPIKLNIFWIISSSVVHIKDELEIYNETFKI